METSILKSTKRILGVAETYEVFDLDIITHINAAFATLNQLGIGPEEGFAIDDDSYEWDDLGLPIPQLSLVKTYIYVKVKMLFDPATMSFLIDAQNKQLEQLEWRLNVMRENLIPIPTAPTQEDSYNGW